MNDFYPAPFSATRGEHGSLHTQVLGVSVRGLR
jgi:hypothetical protein